MVLPHERHPLPEHEPTHREILEKLESIERILRRLEERR